MQGCSLVSRSVFGRALRIALLTIPAIFADDQLLQQISSASRLTASVTPEGIYQVTASDFQWTFSGATGQQLKNTTVSNGSDAIGSWVQISFAYDPSRTSSIRLYNESPVVLFSTRYGADSPNQDPFPHFTTYPQGLLTFSYNGLWNPSFGMLSKVSPWLLYDSQAHAMIFSPASNYMTAQMQTTVAAGIQAAIDPRITTLPAGFTHSSFLVFGPGVNSAFDAWGQALTGLSGKHRSANDSIPMLNKVSYWTDAGAAYYYSPKTASNVVPTLEKLPPQFAQMYLPLGSMELDSWYYPKGSPPSWTLNGFGMATYQADPSVFPNGLGAFQQSLGIPLITHARWIDSTSPLRSTYKMSNNVSIDPQYWQDYAQYLSNNGVTVLEQDWLSNQATTDFNLTDPYLFLDNMAAKMSAAGIKLMYCMPLPSHFLQSTNYDSVVGIRVGSDAFARVHWDELLLGSRLAQSVGLWPFADELQTVNVKDVLMSTLTAGPLGLGDALGTTNAANLRQAVRADGVIVKPDVPALPMDSSWVGLSLDQTAPMVASTYTDHGSHRTAFVVAYDRTNGALGSMSFSPESIGIKGPAYVYDYFASKGSVVSAGGQFTDVVDYNGSYYVVAPIGPSGIAFLGDKGKFVSTGKKRIETLSDDGTLHVSVRFAPGETSVVLHVYSPTRPVAVSITPGALRMDSEGKNRYRLTVSANAAGLVSLGFTQSGEPDSAALPPRH